MIVATENVQVVVLAAGEGNRLRPYTADKPKCMVPLNDQALIEYQLRALRSVGLTDICIATGYRADQLEKLGYPTRHNKKYESSNMVETLMCAKDVLLNGKDTLIAYADIVYQPDVVTALLACNSEFATVVDRNWLALWQLRGEDPLDDAETLRVEGGLVLEVGKKPTSVEEIQGQYIGMSYLGAAKAQEFVDAFYKLPASGKVFDGRDRQNMYMTSFLQHLVDEGWPLTAAFIESGWIEVDTTTDLELYEGLVQKGDLDRFVRLEHR